MKTIEVSDELYDQLIELSKELNTQDNRATASPYIFQIQTKMEVAAYPGNGEQIWYNSDNERTLRTADEIKQYILEYMVEDLEIYGSEALTEAEGRFNCTDTSEWLECHDFCKYDVDQVENLENAFLTAKACKEHIRLNHYHYREPVDYLTHAFRNPELEMVLGFLKQLTKS